MKPPSGGGKTNPIQTQTNPISSEAKMSLNISLTRNYDNNLLLSLRQNKPKTNPISKKAKNERK